MHNVLVFLIDAGRSDRVASRQRTPSLTPNIDQLAQDSVLFAKAYSPAAWTLPAITSMFTGLYPSEHGVHFGNPHLDDQHLTLAELLTVGGFDTYGASSNAWIASPTGLNRGFQHFRLVDRIFQTMPPKRWQAAVERAARMVRRPKDAGGEQITRWASEMLRQRQPGRPFFMFLHYLEPHAPYRPPWQWAQPFFQDQAEYQEALRLADIELAYLARKVDLTQRQLELIGRLYDSLIMYSDHQIGQVLDVVYEQGLLEDTMIVVTADHGENLGEHGLLGHQYCLYDSLLHIPLIMRFPGQHGFVVRDDLVLNTDIFSTILSLAGYGAQNLASRQRWVNLAPDVLKRQAVPDHTFAQYSRPMIERFQRYYPDFDYSVYNHEITAVRSREFKLIRRDDGREELYNISQDPSELHNLVEECVEVAQQLGAILDDHIAASDVTTIEAAPIELDGVTRDRLRSLGYLD